MVEATVRAATADEERIRRRLRIAFTTPSVEAASALQTYAMAGLIARVLAARLQRDPDDLDVQVFAHAFAGGLLGALRHWHASGFASPPEVIFDRPLTVLEGGANLGV